MVGQVSHEVEVNVSANEAWELYGTLQFSKLVEEVLSNFTEKIEVIEGDGGVGTIIKLTFAPGMYHKCSRLSFLIFEKNSFVYLIPNRVIINR